MIPKFNLPKKAVIGMVHVHALPGTPAGKYSVAELIRIAVAEAVALEQAGFDAIIIENMHDAPYLLRTVGPEVVSAMTAVGLEVKKAVGVPLGVQVLAGANKEALAVAHACGATFIRAEGFVFAHVADEGLMGVADAGELLRYRKMIGAESVAVITDIKKKHSSHQLTADVDLAETGHAAEFFGADGVIVTGSSTGKPASVEDVRQASEAVHIPVLVGSGVTPDNLERLWPFADGFIVGSWIKQGGIWSAGLDEERMKSFIEKASELRK